jgi:hydrogenase maturation protease
MLAPFMEEADILYVIDTVNSSEKPGSILRFSDSDCRSRNIQSGMSPHQIGLLEVLELCRLRGHAPDTVEMITVVPEDLSTGIGLSPRLAKQLDHVIDLLRECLLTHDIILKSREYQGA